MKLVSLNCGLFEANNPHLKQFFTQHQPDIVALQEVIRRVDASAKPEFITKDVIDESLGFKNHFYGPIYILDRFEQPNFHGHEKFVFELDGKVDFGNYIGSAFPLISAENFFVRDNYSYYQDWSRKWPHDDARAVLIADLQLPGGKDLRVMTYHGIWSQGKLGDAATKRACEQIRELAEAVEHPVIITGDFNLFPDTPSMQVLSDSFRSLVDEYSIHTTRPQTNELNDQPRNVVDYIFVSDGITVTDFQVPDSDVSDHLPLILEFEVG